jgi:NAD(P)-dependent dehydrogenase (short-subunit alcohol dehydrogenase family)
MLIDSAPLAELAGKVAFITGGSSGIGLGIARACVDAGMKVAVTYLTAEHLTQAKSHLSDCGHDVHAIRLDVTDRHAMERAADEVETKVGAVHLLCNNAGVGVSVPVKDASFDDWDFALGVNLGGVVNGVRTFLPRMMRHGEPAHLLATASMSGLFHGGSAGVYTTTKFAVVGMMEALRSDLAPLGIGVSVCCPGLVATRIFDADRHRPPQSRIPVERAALFRSIVAAGMDPFEYGAKVLEGVRRNDLYILTHSEFEQGIRDRFEALLASVDRGQPVPEARRRAEQQTLRHPLYATETLRRTGAPFEPAASPTAEGLRSGNEVPTDHGVTHR